jgi:malate synthase
MSSRITAKDLLEVPKGRITECGFRRNVDVALQYIESWLRGNGCVPIYHLMEDAATAEISRAQLWQWIRYGARTEDGRNISPQRFEQVLDELVVQMQKTLRAKDSGTSQFDRAAQLLRELSEGDFQEFLTTVAYQDLL